MKLKYESFLQNNGAIEINVQEAEEGWWFGRYDKEQKLIQNRRSG